MSYSVRFEAITAVQVKIRVFWDVTLGGLQIVAHAGISHPEDGGNTVLQSVDDNVIIETA
jgi:hypothetical protein